MASLTEKQKPLAESLLKSLRLNGVSFDTSEMGAGKTYIASWVASQLSNEKILVICPKQVVSDWRYTLSQFGVEAEVLTYRKATLRKDLFRMVKMRYYVKAEYLGDHGLVIFDEAHALGGGSKTKQGAMSLALTAKKVKQHFMSATLGETPLKFQAFLYATGYLKKFSDFQDFIVNYGCFKVASFRGLQFTKNESRAEDAMDRLSDLLFPKFGGGIVTETQSEQKRVAKIFDLSPKENTVIEKAYAELRIEEAIAIVEQNRIRQVIEHIKVPIVAELAKQKVDQGYSVAIFTNFKKTVELLEEILGECPKITGDVSEKDRAKAIGEFQSGKSKIIILNIAAGGAGIDLDDKVGDSPRVSYIFPSFSATEIKQAFGRTKRLSTKSDSTAVLVYAAGTIEESIAKIVKLKLNNLKTLNKNELMGLTV